MKDLGYARDTNYWYVDFACQCIETSSIVYEQDGFYGINRMAIRKGRFHVPLNIRAFRYLPAQPYKGITTTFISIYDLRFVEE